MKEKEDREKTFAEKHRSELFLIVFWIVAGAILFGSGYLASQTNLTSMIMGFFGGI